MRPVLLVESDAPCVFTTKHWLHIKLKLFFACWRNSQFGWCLTIQNVSLYSKIDRFLTVGIFDVNLFFYSLFSLAFDFNVVLSQRVLPISDDFIFKKIQGQRVWHDQSGLCLICPFWLKSNWEIPNTLLLHWECVCILRGNNEILPIFWHIRLPLNLYIPVPICIIDDWKVLSYFSSSGDIHLKNSLERFRLNGKYYSVSSNIGFGLIEN